MRAPLAALALCFLATAAQAEDAPACTQFKWPLATEKSWFEAWKLTEVESGGAMGELAKGPSRSPSSPSGEVAFAMPPESKPKPDKALGATLSFSTVTVPGTYQVTLSEEAWIDIIQVNGYRPSLDFSGVHGCPGMPKSVRFEFKAAPLILQLSSASAPVLELAIRRLPPQ
jgi:hypothetical protein